MVILDRANADAVFGPVAEYLQNQSQLVIESMGRERIKIMAHGFSATKPIGNCAPGAAKTVLSVSVG
jgi:hypothetical protein